MNYREKIEVFLDETIKELAKEKPNLRRASELLKDVKEVHLGGMETECENRVRIRLARMRGELV